ncbi:hypothetical protein PHYPSEUDO_003173 [Phytophthora pseudosyringae]|uniref:BZIP domain-containing protein n=1 Tax=Phytophthora pseudosyringae TaxID=221518 RepID=A0A8T1VWL6_9STRA|nr:hypothetical protein PHYPSEUDO_003173 [Phytophthora pseudosyringae]
MGSSGLIPPNRIQRPRPQTLDHPAVAVRDSNSMTQIDYTRHLTVEEAERKRVAARMELRRQRNNMRQAKHKMKNQQIVLDLEMNIRQLRDAIQQLQLQHEVVSTRIPTNSTVWSVVAEYFHLFRNGFKEPTVSLLPSDSETSLTSLQPRESFVQRDFFLATMAEEVVAGTGVGVQNLLENWRRLSKCQEDVEIELVRLDAGPGNNLLATVSSVSTMSEMVLRHGFPHLFENGELTPLGAKLLGQRMTMHGTVSFVWDEEKGRVAGLQHSVDMLTPMMQLLGNLDDVSRVFAHAHVTPESRLASS